MLPKRRGKRSVGVGVIGLGYIGAFHARYLAAGAIRHAQLTAVCDPDARARAGFRNQVPAFASAEELVRSGWVEAVIIAVPTHLHALVAEMSLRASLHVLVEKPLARSLAEAKRMLRVRHRRRHVFAIMLNQRANPLYRRVKDLLDRGAVGPLQRVSWIMTEWFRPNAYYASAPWRGTWRGEGGGVLMNQYVHHLDLLQWLCGMPHRVTAFAGWGKYHPIEVEDEVTAYLEWPGGATGVFVGSTGEAPGSNRLEIAGDRGQLVVEKDRIVLRQNTVATSQFRQTGRAFMGKPRCRQRLFVVRGSDRLHQAVTQNFVDAILDGAPLIAPAEEGLRSLEIANALILSAARTRPVLLPLRPALYERFLNRKQKELP